MNAHEKLADIQVKLSVQKGQRNDFGGFDYRNAEDILKAVKPLLGGFTITTDTNIQSACDRVYIEAVATLSNGETEISAKGYAREPLHRKGMDESQVTGAATSYAKKYALGNLLAIDNEADADSMDNSSEGVSEKKPILTAAYTTDWARAIEFYMANGNLDAVLASRDVSPEDQAAIASQAKALQYERDAQADHRTENQQ
ncbi:MAG: ERF family protein [Gammaproteobacteria bacterium]|nr:ERF family protein [Gammaproteobacteria bacterium]